MSAEASEAVPVVEQSDQGDDIKTAMHKKAMRKLAQAQALINEANELLDAVCESSKAPVQRVDQYGEPTWNYAVGVKIPKDIYLTRAFAEYAAKFDFSEESARILFEGKGTYEGFKGYYERVHDKKNGKWAHWTKVWQKWVRSERDRKDKAQAKNPSGETRFSRTRTRG